MRRNLTNPTRLLISFLTFIIGITAATVRLPRKQSPPPPCSPPVTQPPTQILQTEQTEQIVDAAKPATPRITQEIVTRFPRLGLVQVRAVENFDEPMRIEFLNAETDAMLAAFPAPTSEIPAADAKFTNPFLRFKVLRVEGLPQPLIFAVAVTPGGSDCGFYAMIIGEHKGQLKVLTPEPLATNIQGGIYVGDLGGGRGVGAGVWTFIWDFDSEGHYSTHRYEVEVYPFDFRRKRFEKAEVLKSKNKYGGQGEDALTELRLKFTDLLQDMPDVSMYHRL